MSGNLYINQSFRVYEAEKYGLNCSLLIDIFRRELILSKASEKFITKIGDKNYFYIKYKPSDLETVLPYITRGAINTAKKELLDSGFILMGTENQSFLTIPSEFEVDVTIVEPEQAPLVQLDIEQSIKDTLSKEQNQIVNGLLSRFSKFMPGSAAYAPVQRKAMVELLKEFQQEKVMQMLDKNVSNIESRDQFAPKAFSARQLQEKWYQIDNYKNQKEVRTSSLQEI